MRLRPGFCTILAVIFLSTAIANSAATEEVRHSGTLVDNAGKSRTFAFRGAARDSTLNGVLTVDSDSAAVSGNIAKDGSVSGQLAVDGKPIGRFWGQRVGNEIKGSFDIDGRVGDWSVPANKLPMRE